MEHSHFLSRIRQGWEGMSCPPSWFPSDGHGNWRVAAGKRLSLSGPGTSCRNCKCVCLKLTPALTRLQSSPSPSVATQTDGSFRLLWWGEPLHLHLPELWGWWDSPGQGACSPRSCRMMLPFHKEKPFLSFILKTRRETKDTTSEAKHEKGQAASPTWIRFACLK